MIELAVRANRFESVQLLLDHVGGVDIHQWIAADENDTDDTGPRQLIHLAASRGDERIFALLADRGADLQRVLPLRLNLFAIAAKNRNEKIVQMLVALGVPGMDEESAALVHAAANENEAVLSTLIDAGAAKAVIMGELLDNAAANANVRVMELVLARCGVTAVHIDEQVLFVAACNANCEVLRRVLAVGGDVNAIDGESGHTALHFAAMGGLSDTISVLIENGANCDVADHNGETPCAIALQRGCIGAAERLLRAGALAPSCRFAVQHWDSFELLLRIGVADWRSEFAAVCELAGHHTADNLVVDFLLSADMPSQLASQRLLAIRRDHPIVRRLIDADAVAVDSGALMEAAIQSGSVVALRLLVAAGADVNMRTKVSHAARSQTLQQLFALGANFDLRDADGLTSIQRFAKYSFFDEELLSVIAAGADLTVRNSEGATPGETASPNFVSVGALFVALGHPVDTNAIPPSNDDVERALERIATRQFELLRLRGIEICVGLHALDLNALQLCEIMSYAFAPLESMVPFHKVWKIATTAKHFRRQQ